MLTNFSNYNYYNQNQEYEELSDTKIEDQPNELKTASIGDISLALNFSTLIGGNYNDLIRDITIDSKGDIIIAGSTESSNLPASINAFQQNSRGLSDAFIAKFSQDGSELKFLTYFGGSGYDAGVGVSADSNDNIWLTGFSASSNLPYTDDAYQTNFRGGGADGFISKFSSNGSTLLYSTYIGGSGYDWCYGAVVDSNDNLICTGHMYSSNLATLNVFQPSFGGGVGGELGDAVVIKLNSSGDLQFFSYLGGSNNDWGTIVDCDTNDNILVIGLSYSNNFPTMNATQLYQGNSDGFISVVSPDGKNLLFSTYLGGSEKDYLYGGSFDSMDNIVVTGATESSDFLIENSYQSTIRGEKDLILTKLNKVDYSINFSTYIGGNNDESKWGNYGSALAIDSNDNIHIIGNSNSENYPLKNAGQTAYAGGDSDVIFSIMDQNGQNLLYSTYIGGEGEDQGNGVFIDKYEKPIIYGYTKSNDFPLKNPFQNDTKGYFDGFITLFRLGNEKFGPQVPSTIPGYSILAIIFLLGLISASSALILKRVSVNIKRDH